MTIRWLGHNYSTQFGHSFRSLFEGYSLKSLVWFGHGDDCCDYWMPIESTEAHQALMTDDDLKLSSDAKSGRKDT